MTVVLGGDCTIGVGTVAGQLAGSGDLGLLYFDTHADLNVPSVVREGALDWMGMAHMLAEPGARPELVWVGPRAPLLRDEQVLLFGWGPEQATAFERAAIERRGLERIAVDEVAADPAGAAARALASLEARCERVLVHFDVDVVDFTDAPLSENTGRNEGLPLACALAALEALLASPPPPARGRSLPAAVDEPSRIGSLSSSAPRSAAASDRAGWFSGRRRADS